jgi:hypothetical protein
MKRVTLRRDQIVLSQELGRSGESKQFEDRLRASIEQIGLSEPIKVAKTPNGKYLLVDGSLRIKAIDAIRESNPESFRAIPAYIVDYAKRFEVRYQTDIYQDLLPSQLAILVEHLHSAELVRKVDIARYIGVSPPTLRNYTGVGRMLNRGVLFSRLVDLMDVGVLPASNPYAWLRLTSDGVRYVIETSFSNGERAEIWIKGRVARARRGDVVPFPLKFVESETSNLPAHLYREIAEVRDQKRDLGLRRAPALKATSAVGIKKALDHLSKVSKRSREPVLRAAARSMAGYLQ